MKILQLIQRPQLRGAEIFACQLAAQLVRRGHKLRVASLFPGEAALSFPVDPMTIGTHPRMRWIDLPGWWRLYRLVREFKPDIIQANAADTLKYAVFSRIIFRWKARVVFRNANLMSAFLDSSIKFKLNRWTLCSADHIISVSESCSADLVDKIRISGEKISTVEIGIELEETTGRLQAESVNNEFTAFSGAAPLLVNVAGFVPEKNHEGLIRIFALIKKSFPKVKLLLVGRGPLRQRIEAQVAELGLSDDVIFLGSRSDVPWILQECKVFLMPSFIEGLPGVILESMFARCPVVAYAAGGIPDVVADHQTGRLVAIGDETGFAEIVLGCLQRDDTLQEIRERAYEMVRARFDNRFIAVRFEEVYFRITDSENWGGR